MADITGEARKHAGLILSGVVLAVDPASGGTSSPGWAVYGAGKLMDSGVLTLGKNRVQHRLRDLYYQLEAYEDCDVLVIERIRGSRAHEYLRWSVGVSIAAVAPALLFEMPVTTWKKIAGKAHQKSDENDAVAIGQALITLASKGQRSER